MMEKCSHCEGEGWVTTLARNDGYYPDGEDVNVICPQCHGTGKPREVHADPNEKCISCEEGTEKNVCMSSPRDCRHHCNHSWSHDSCCYCGTEVS